ncbi:TetR/AcrR family transcriptional regulator [Alkaliphilus pronyensis]|uniref:TetR/AcrR family transcriptional regulator n=1 Tax=Alkaliphilus pronyensis TaxID=1482732 RepID=A0A6I0F175_9FIRM|nr:TetR/AcrR family transcriptional regulator [Alkaliphilus pronyensis]KAB3536088.1 TetR/AcrR family transcriptional regulator [Alkaliphilus pronyensis]
MSGLRERKKKNTEEKILSAGKEILLSKGYNDATMEEIADKAEIGVGTLYNYFKSKGEIFVKVISKELYLDENNNEETTSVIEMVISYLWKYIMNMKLFGKLVWRELFAVMFASTKTDDLNIKGLVNIDVIFVKKLEQLLDSAIEKEMLPKGFDSKEASYIIFSIIFTQTMMYIYMEEISFEEFETQVKNQITFLFEGKC